MRHPMGGWFLGQPWWTMHPKIDDARTAQKFAARGRQKGAPGDSPIFRIIIRLENAEGRLRRELRGLGGRVLRSEVRHSASFSEAPNGAYIITFGDVCAGRRASTAGRAPLSFPMT